jgi:hypothetical protein
MIGTRRWTDFVSAERGDPRWRIEGLWRGTTSDDQTAVGIVMDDGTYYLLYSYSGGPGDASIVSGFLADGVSASRHYERR